MYRSNFVSSYQQYLQLLPAARREFEQFQLLSTTHQQRPNDNTIPHWLVMCNKHPLCFQIMLDTYAAEHPSFDANQFRQHLLTMTFFQYQQHLLNRTSRLLTTPGDRQYAIHYAGDPDELPPLTTSMTIESFYGLVVQQAEGEIATPSRILNSDVAGCDQSNRTRRRRVEVVDPPFITTLLIRPYASPAKQVRRSEYRTAERLIPLHYEQDELDFSDSHQIRLLPRMIIPVMIYAPPCSGKTHFQREHPSVANTNNMPWNVFPKVVISDRPHLLRQAIFSIAIIPTEREFRRRCLIRGQTYAPQHYNHAVTMSIRCDIRIQDNGFVSDLIREHASEILQFVD